VQEGERERGREGERERGRERGILSFYTYIMYLIFGKELEKARERARQ
jgi:hypothetical protein